MALRKIELMHKLFGKADGKKCANCVHIQSGRYHDRVYRKCDVYGLSHSEASDWCLKYDACGLFNKPITPDNVIRLVEKDRIKANPTTEIPGQTNLFGGQNDD